MYRKRTSGSRKFNARMARARAAKEKIRLEGPSPDYPVKLPQVRRRVIVEDYDFGETVRHEFVLERSNRTDCYRVIVDGVTIPSRMGWAKTLEMVRKAFVRVAAAPFK
ncbi:hypothetical protein [Geoalkalibacter sp.]|uniref:hypothetical protein n=1 Tax=Geoalkalibacter sp. TaxID=3041440 RepID=UPI00272E8F4A|nr:hypothetical protein [Geoalkalibacter sp.]